MPDRAEQYTRIDHNMTNHPIADQARIDDIEFIRFQTKELAKRIVDLTLPSREQSLALTDLESALMWTVAAIARNQ